jgi:polysaccharide export outer membrane protein
MRELIPAAQRGWTPTMQHQYRRTFVLSLLLMASSNGCHTFVYPGRNPNGPQPYVPLSAPKELSKTTLPDYIIEPPDVLVIDALLRAAPTYRLRPSDAVTVIAGGDILDAYNFSNQYLIQPDGSILLTAPGPDIPQGLDLSPIQAAGLTTAELRDQLLARQQAFYRPEINPTVTVSIALIAAEQQIAGEHLVTPDGTVNLGFYGRVRVAGRTIEEARTAIRDHLVRQDFDPEVAVDVVGYNSKVYYVVTQGAGLGDQVTILPARGNETVLDAIGQIQGLNSNNSTRMWIARPGGNDLGGDQILPVDWLAVTQRGDISTNYQVLPGDRVYVSEDKLVAVDTKLGKIISPLERILGVTALATSTAKSIHFFNQFNTGGGGF